MRLTAGNSYAYLNGPTRPLNPPKAPWPASLHRGQGPPELADLIGKIRAGRRGSLINVYKLLLHTPPLAAIWLEFVSAARFKTELDGRLREIVIVRVAHLNRTTYVFKQHVPQLSAPEGLTDAECDALADWVNATSFSSRERAALAYTDAMTRDIVVPDGVFDALRPHFNERQIVEL